MRRADGSTPRMSRGSAPLTPGVPAQRAQSEPGPHSPSGSQQLASGESGPVPAGRSAPLSRELRELGDRYRVGKHRFLGVGLSCLADEEFLDAVEQAAKTRSRLTVSFINPDYLVRAHRIPNLAAKVNRFDIVLPDGWGIVLGGRWLGLPVPDRQGNDDICPKLFALSAARQWSNFLFGCAEGVPERAAANLTKTFPGLPIAGTLHGYWDVVRGNPGRYDEADITMMVDAINASNADILHVSLPTPMQQTWVWDVADRLQVPVIITGGSYLDHLAERVYWYPGWVNRMRLGWAYRLSREPGRLWKRYSLDLLAYGRMLLAEKRATRHRLGR